MTKDNPLTFEEFSKWEEGFPKYNNFYLYFVEIEDASLSGYRTLPHIVKFREEHPELKKKLTDLITEPIKKRQFTFISTKEILPPFERDLYEAYLIMRGYVESDEVLFG